VAEGCLYGSVQWAAFFSKRPPCLALSRRARTALCCCAPNRLRHEVRLIPSPYVKPFVSATDFDRRTLISDALPLQADFRSGFAAFAPPLAFTSAAWSLTVCSA
jgi:hypothetical protein